MNVFVAFAIFISIAAVASYINYRYIKLPTAIGLMFIGLTMSLAVIGLANLGIGIDIESWATRFLGSIDFGEALMKGMLSFLLFAGALKININDLAEKKWIISLLATGGVILTTFLVGTVIYYTLHMLDISIPFIYCLVFGALIAPTDPVAVMALLRSVGAPRSLETKIAGESLFNDGVGVVVFTVLLGLAIEGGRISFGHVALLFVEEVIGGFVFGFVIGYVAYRLLKNVDDHSVEILLTLGLVCGGYALASTLHVSGPIAIVVAGLLIGNYGRRFAMSETTRDHLDKFWELIDETLNAVLFVWIGIEILVLSFTLDHFLAGLIAIPVVLAARFASVSAAIHTLRIFKRQFSGGAIRILTWGGLRGGISIALALSIPAGKERDLIVAITYVVVVFSILVQGLTIKKVIHKSIAESRNAS
jgi:CPA1 family monovalent cation:H+ antiporter